MCSILPAPDQDGVGAGAVKGSSKQNRAKGGKGCNGMEVVVIGTDLGGGGIGRSSTHCLIPPIMD